MVWIEALDDMKNVKRNRCFGKILKKGAEGCRRQIHSDNLYFCFETLQLFPEMINSGTPLAHDDEKHRSRFHIQTHPKVPMSLQNRNLINGNPPNVFQTLSEKSPGKTPRLTLFDLITRRFPNVFPYNIPTPTERTMGLPSLALDGKDGHPS
jgi:hypothetical protein